MYRDCKYFENEKCSNELENELSKGSLTLNYNIFQNVCLDIVNKHSSLRKKVHNGKSCTWIRS